MSQYLSFLALALDGCFVNHAQFAWFPLLRMKVKTSLSSQSLEALVGETVTGERTGDATGDVVTGEGIGVGVFGPHEPQALGHLVTISLMSQYLSFLALALDGRLVNHAQFAWFPLSRMKVKTSLSSQSLEALVGETVTGERTGDATGDVVTGERTGDATGDAVTGERTGDVTGDVVTGERTGDATGDVVTGERTGDATGDVVTGERTGDVTGDAVTGERTGDATGDVVTGERTGDATGGVATGEIVVDGPLPSQLSVACPVA